MTGTWRNRLLLLIALALAAIYLFPLYWMYVTSLKTGSEMFATPPTFLPVSPQWGTYATVWTGRNMGMYMGNSLIIATGTMVLVRMPGLVDDRGRLVHQQAPDYRQIP